MTERDDGEPAYPDPRGRWPADAMQAAREWADKQVKGTGFLCACIAAGLPEHRATSLRDPLAKWLAAAVLALVQEQREDAWCRGHAKRSETVRAVAASDARQAERAAVVAWLRDTETAVDNSRYLAAEIEKGEHHAD
jgi:hypothetical protein